MKYLIIIFMLFTFLSCSEKEEDFIPEKFEIQRTHVELPFRIKDIIQFEDGYVCIFENFNDSLNQIGFLDNNFKLKSERSKALNKNLDYVRAIWTSVDTLFLTDIYTIKYWKHNKWNFYKTIPEEDYRNYRSNELDYPIYEDDKFRIRSCCRGEFGGAIFFYDKQTGKTYSCESTSLKAVHKIEGSYYVTSSLPHGSGFSKMIKIDDPRKLYEIKNKNQLTDCSWYDIYSEDPKNDEVKHPVGYDKGYDVLLDTMGIMIVGTFLHKDHMYSIFSDDTHTYLGYFKNKKPIIMDTLINKISWFGPVRDLKHNSNIFPINSRFFNGIIKVDKTKIFVTEFI